jgi:rod shape-determining protein MreC
MKTDPMFTLPIRGQRSAALAIALSVQDVRFKISLGLFLILAFTFLILGHSHNRIAVMGRMMLTDFFAPTVHFMAQPVQQIASFGDNWQQWQNVYAENERLRAENTQLKQWQHLSLDLSAQNEALRELLHSPVVASHSYLSAKIIGGGATAFDQTQILDSGVAEGVAVDMPVISSAGIVGRVTETGVHTARVMPITDINSRIAVVSQDGREHAIAAGRNDELLELRYLPRQSTLKLGEIVVTSGDAALIPSGIPVGRVVQVKKDRVLVRPLIDWSRLDFVSLIAS